jgi:TonB family protein
MRKAIVGSHLRFFAAPARLGAVALGGALALALAFSAQAQQPAPPDAAETAATPAALAETTPVASAAKTQKAGQPASISEDELKKLLTGKTLYLRGGYLDNTLSFDAHGRLIGHSAQGSYTLAAIQIGKVRFGKHKVELAGLRYGLHFASQLAYEDSSMNFDQVRITPRKKVVKISIEREIAVNPKKKKEPAAGKGPAGKGVAGKEVESKDHGLKAESEQPAAAHRSAAPGPPEAITPEDTAKLLRKAIDSVFAQGLDERMVAAMPEFWRLYYQAAAVKADYRPSDPSILRQNTVDEKARLVTSFEPDSNEFAQANGIVGMALYHTVVSPDGKAREIAVGRPIGFGLDENAVEAIRKASFQPAVKDGHPVAVLLDLVVQFHIFSQRTATVSQPEPAEGPAEAMLPGPYSVPRP